jgi:O-antigen/teichoic acid export membrane protein
MHTYALLVVCIGMLNKLKQKTYTMLRASEKYTKTDMVYLTKGSLWMMVGNAISILSVFFTAIAFAHFIPQDTYGIYKFILAVASVLMFFSLSGLPGAVTQAVARGFEGTFRKSLKIRIMWGLLGGIASLLISGYYFLQGDTVLSTSFFIIAFFIPFFESIGLYENYLQGKSLFGYFITFNSISRIISFAILLLTIFFSKNIFLILIAYFLPPIIIKATFDAWTIRRFSPNELVDENTIMYGKHLSINGVISKTAMFLDTILLFHFLGPIQVAIYSFALAPIEQIKSTYKSIPLLTVPKLAVRTPETINSRLYRRLVQLFFIGAGIAVVYASFAPLLFKTLFSTYTDAIIFSQVLSVILILSLPNAFLESIQQAKLDITPTTFLYWRNVPSVLLIMSLLLLTPMYGIWGVIVSRVIYLSSMFICNAIQWRMLSSRQALQ